MYGKLLIFFCICSFIFACNNKNEKPTDFEQKISVSDSLALELCKIYGLDQGIRKSPGMKNKWDFIHPIDSINFDKVMKIIKEYGFPNKEFIGKLYTNECVSASAFAVLLHSPQKIVNNKKNLDILVEEVKKGNLKQDGLLFVLDKYYIIRRDQAGNSKIVYGSQFGKPCIKYRKKSDSLRAEIGLKPLSISEFKKCN